MNVEFRKQCQEIRKERSLGAKKDAPIWFQNLKTEMTFSDLMVDLSKRKDYMFYLELLLLALNRMLMEENIFLPHLLFGDWFEELDVFSELDLVEQERLLIMENRIRDFFT